MGSCGGRATLWRCAEIQGRDAVQLQFMKIEDGIVRRMSDSVEMCRNTRRHAAVDDQLLGSFPLNGGTV